MLFVYYYFICFLYILALNLTITFQKASDPLDKKTNPWNWAPQTGSLETRGDCKLNWPAWFGKQWRPVVTRTQWFLEKMALCKDAKHKQSSAIWIDLFYCKMTEACKDNKYSVKSPVGQTQFTPSTMIFGGKSPPRTNSKWSWKLSSLVTATCQVVKPTCHQKHINTQVTSRMPSRNIT